MTADRSALLIVDVQVDFCPGGALPAPQGDTIIPALNRYIAQAVENGMPIYASRDWHPPVTTHFKAYGGVWPPHCVQGTAGASFHPDLHLPADAITVTKGDVPDREGYSAFDGTTPDGQRLADHLRAGQIDTLYVGGIATDYCVKESVLDARRHGFTVHLLPDAVTGIDVQAGDSEHALEEMRAAGAQIATGLSHGQG